MPQLLQLSMNLLNQTKFRATLVIGLILQAVAMYLSSIYIQFLIVMSLAIGFNV
jgi:hypothetical protein